MKTATTPSHTEDDHHDGSSRHLLHTKLIDLFGGVKQFNTAMAIMGPSIINLLQHQVASETALIGTFQMGSGLLLWSGNSMFWKSGDPSLHSKMGMLTGGIKTCAGIALLGIGLASVIGVDSISSTGLTLAYLAYSLKTLTSVIDLFNAFAYGKDIMHTPTLEPGIKQD